MKMKSFPIVRVSLFHFTAVAAVQELRVQAAETPLYSPTFLSTEYCRLTAEQSKSQVLRTASLQGVPLPLCGNIPERIAEVTILNPEVKRIDQPA